MLRSGESCERPYLWCGTAGLLVTLAVAGAALAVGVGLGAALGLAGAVGAAAGMGQASGVCHWHWQAAAGTDPLLACSCCFPGAAQ